MFFIHSGTQGIDVYMYKVYLILYADDIVIFGNSAEELKQNIQLLADCCKTWKMKVNTTKTKVMIFRKGSTIPRNIKFYYDDHELEIVKHFTYLGIVLTSGGSLATAQNTLWSSPESHI